MNCDENMMSWEQTGIGTRQDDVTSSNVGKGQQRPRDDAVSLASGSSSDWCEGSVGSLVSLGDDCYSVTSNFSCDDSIEDAMDGINCIQNLEPVKIEPTLFRKCCDSRVIAQTLRTNFSSGPATVVSSTCSSTIRSCLEDEEDLDSVFDEIMGCQQETHSVQGCSAVQGVPLPKTRGLERQRPFESIPDDLVCDIFRFLKVDSLCTTRCVSKRFSHLASRDEAGWRSICESTWSRKAHVCWRAIHMKKTVGSMLAYRESCQDGRNRHEITPNELCFDPLTGRGTVWYFRFKRSAGPAWTSLDPWYAGGSAKRMVFLRDGTVWQFLSSIEYAEVGDNEEGRSSGTGRPFHLKPAFFDTLDGNAAGRPQQDERVASSRIDMKWRFILHPMDLPLRPRGAYIRLNVGARDVPTYIVKRSPTNNWGFIMENCWGVFASFRLPRRQSLDAGRERPARIRLRRTSSGVGRWLNVEGIESDSEEDDEGFVEEDNYEHEHGDAHGGATSYASDATLLEDDALPTTNRSQWREALLYNYGAVSLPEGPTATAEFDRIFRSFRSPRRPLDMHNFLQ